MIRDLSSRLTGEQRRYLRGLAHDLNPVVLVGQRGISDNLIENVEAALLAHELIKVKVHGGDEIAAVAQTLRERTGAQIAQHIGHILVLYKPHPEDPEIKLPT